MVRNHHITIEELDHLRNLSTTGTVQIRDIHTTMANLRSTIDSLPKFLPTHINIIITDGATPGTLEGGLVINGFTGRDLVVWAPTIENQPRHTITEGLHIINCTSNIGFRGGIRLRFTASPPDIISVMNCGNIHFTNIECVRGASDNDNSAIRGMGCNHISIGTLIASNFPEVGNFQNTRLSIQNLQGANNVRGIINDGGIFHLPSNVSSGFISDGSSWHMVHSGGLNIAHHGVIVV